MAICLSLYRQFLFTLFHIIYQSKIANDQLKFVDYQANKESLIKAGHNKVLFVADFRNSDPNFVVESVETYISNHGHFYPTYDISRILLNQQLYESLEEYYRHNFGALFIWQFSTILNIVIYILLIIFIFKLLIAMTPVYLWYYTTILDIIFNTLNQTPKNDLIIRRVLRINPDNTEFAYYIKTQGLPFFRNIKDLDFTRSYAFYNQDKMIKMVEDPKSSLFIEQFKLFLNNLDIEVFQYFIYFFGGGTS